MKKFFLLLIIGLVASSAGAQLLWKVTGDKLAKPSYLFGTYHLISGNFIDSVAQLPRVIQDVDAVWVEIEADSMKNANFLAKSAQMLQAPQDSTLDKLLKGEDFKVVQQVIDKHFGILGVGIEPFLQLKPAAIANQLVMIQAAQILQNIDTGNLLDGAVQRRVNELGKPAHSLETTDFQINLFFGSPLAKQATDLLEMCKADDHMSEALTSMTRAYQEQNLKKLLEIMQDPAIGGNKDDLKALIFDRNRNWVKKLVPVMEQQSVLVAVGAGHLPMGEGLIELLRQAGYTVEPVK